jgi:CBS domain-containing protein
MVRRHLKSAGLTTKPDFEYAYIDGFLQFVLVEEQSISAYPSVSSSPSSASPLSSSSPSPVDEVVPEPTPISAIGIGDPTYRIGKLESANTPPVSVGPSATLAQAITVMLYNDFSQLPVMQGERDLKGAVSWRSIGRTLALGHSCLVVRDCLEEATVISSDTSLFSAIPTIVEKEYVLIRDSANRISGIVTTTDLSLQFRQLAEPFLLLGEIENHLRRLSDGRFTLNEVSSVKDPADTARQIADLADLTLGEHIRLLEKPERWSALGLSIDRGEFVRYLNDVRDIRNDVMHFDPDGVAPEDLSKLRRFTRLLASLGVGTESDSA